MRSSIVRLAVLLAAGWSAATGTASGLDCEAPAQAEALFGQTEILLLGEIHGTTEGPAFALDVACLAARGDLPALIGLEVAPAEQGRVDLRNPDARQSQGLPDLSGGQGTGRVAGLLSLSRVPPMSEARQALFTRSAVVDVVDQELTAQRISEMVAG